MMENRYLPCGLRIAERIFKPGGLGSIEVGRVEHEELRQAVAPFQLVVRSAAHVEQGILALVLASVVYIVVAQYRIKINPILQQIGKRMFKMFSEIASATVGINVVSSGDDEIERRTLVREKHLLRDPDLIAAARTPIADNGEA